MKMEVMFAAPNLDFDFNSARSSPQVSAPSTPKRFGEYYFSAPASPSRLSQYYNDFDEFFVSSDESGGGLSATVPFSWEEKPGTPKSPVVAPVIVSDTGDHGFVFDVSQVWDTESLSAEDLFDGGVIKPLKPPPPPPVGSRKISQGTFSPRHNNKGKLPFAVAARNATKEAAPPQRGRERGVDLSNSSSRRAARSLSPSRDNKLPWELGGEEPQDAKNCLALSSASSKGQKKWRLKDFFLFRSASEGRAADKDPLKKYTAAFFRRSSFKAIESAGSGSGSRRRGPVSAHELHYTVNRAVSEDLKRKTFLPYKQGILGRLAFNPAAHALANGFGFSRK